jgi:apolipoprotein N-acyltransferase
MATTTGKPESSAPLALVRRLGFGEAGLRTAGLLAVSVLALSLSFAPIGQFYLAWVGLAPFLLAMRQQRSVLGAFVWGWAAGVVFFVVNMWWLEYVTLAGTAALAVYLALFFGLVAALVRGCRLLGRFESSSGEAEPPRRPLRCALLIAAMWVGLEWVRGNYSPFGAHGLPWLFLGATQTPLLAGCQVADLGGTYAVSFWVVLLNALAALIWIDRRRIARLIPAIATIGSVVVLVMAYGIYRLTQDTTHPGPTVLVVQCNYPQSNTGDKGAPIDQIVDFHLHETESALLACEREGRKVDLVVWSETMMPPLNDATRVFWRGLEFGQFIETTSQQISDLADRFRVSFLVGSTYASDWQWVAGQDGQSRPVPTDRRNSAYEFGPTGLMAAERYDKIQLLPFGEFVPFREEIPWLYRILVSLGPPDMKEYELTAGLPTALTVFKLDRVSGGTANATGPAGEPVAATQAWRFVVPICFEDIVSPLVDDLMWDHNGKRADFIVNVTNDGWFHGSERPQHLQAACFRSIEHRVPTARSVNTGISAFIDSDGRITDRVAPETEGWSVRQLQIDDRTTLYSRVGDAFAELCAGVAGLIILYGGCLVVAGRKKKAAG